MDRIPLLNKQKDDIYKLWCDTHNEHLFHRKRLFIEFCEENKCDIVFAIEHIINSITNKDYVEFDGKSYYYLPMDIPIFGLDMLEIEYNEVGDSLFFTRKILTKEFEIEEGHFVNDAPYANLKVVSTKVVKEDIEILNDWKKEFEKIDINPTSTTQNTNLTIRQYDEEQTKKLYEECNNVVFKYCKLNDFVNSLNNPDVCKIEVKNKNLLYVLYTYFFNFFGDEGEAKIAKLNEKFGITERRYGQKKYRPESQYTSDTQKEFDKILAKI